MTGRIDSKPVWEIGINLMKASMNSSSISLGDWNKFYESFHGTLFKHQFRRLE
jgi:hypothetical protein